MFNPLFSQIMIPKQTRFVDNSFLFEIERGIGLSIFLKQYNIFGIHKRFALSEI